MGNFSNSPEAESTSVHTSALSREINICWRSFLFSICSLKGAVYAWCIPEQKVINQNAYDSAQYFSIIFIMEIKMVRLTLPRFCGFQILQMSYNIYVASLWRNIGVRNISLTLFHIQTEYPDNLSVFWGKKN